MGWKNQGSDFATSYRYNDRINHRIILLAKKLKIKTPKISDVHTVQTNFSQYHQVILYTYL